MNYFNISDGRKFSLHLHLTVVYRHFHPDFNFFLFFLWNKPTQLMGNYFYPGYFKLNPL